MNQMIASYTSFFNWKEWIHTFTTPSSLGLILVISLLECLLSIDNALVLSTLVKKLPREQQKKALFYGLIGAYLFRFIMIGIGTYLIHFSIVKLFGSFYLLMLSIKFFFKKRTDQDEKNLILRKKSTPRLGLFWSTVITIELMDFIFSIDSIFTSIAISEEIWVIVFGGFIGILCMRGVASIFIDLITKIPELETTAYFLIGAIGGKLFLSFLQIPISSKLFLQLVILSFLATFWIHYFHTKKSVL